MRKVFVIIACLLITGTAVSQAATSNDYCVSPISSTNAVEPDVMIVMDLSGSMQFPTYYACDFNNYDNSPINAAQCGVSKTTSSDYSASKYNTSTTYYGLFNTASCYTYNSTNKRFEVNSSGVCTNMIGTYNSVSGNLLNWITTTRIDVARKALTGGRTITTVTANDTLRSEGARFYNTGGNYQSTFVDTTSNCIYSITAPSYSYDRLITITKNTSGSCPLTNAGTTVINNAYIRVGVDPSTVTGIVDDFYGQVYFEFMGFNGTSTATEGQIMSGKADTLATLKNQINTSLPINGTPTGEALRSAYNFFAQQTVYTGYANNSAYISKGNGNIDPWYDMVGSTSVAIPCRRSFILLFSDGAWNGSVDPVNPIYAMHVNDLRTDTGLPNTQNVSTYTVYAFGDLDPTTKLQGEQAMTTMAIFGGFDFQSSSSYPYPFTSLPASSLNVTYPLSQCNPAGTWNTQCTQWDPNRTGLPYNFFEASQGSQLVTNLTAALNDIVRQTSSGTAASVLASAKGSGASLLQAVYYPKRMFDVEVTWTGEMQNLWYYIDPYVGHSTIREDTNTDNALELTTDDIIQFYYDTTLNKTRANRYRDSNGDNIPDTLDTPSPVDVDQVLNLWEAGGELWRRNISTNPRNIFTSLTGAEPKLAFTSGNASTLQTPLQSPTLTDAQNVINYINGIDVAGFRNRTVTTTFKGTTGQYVWKLGDIVSSTPRLKSTLPLNTYNLPPPSGYNDQTYSDFVNDNPSGTYQQRGVAYVGANDGMLHAFELGKLSFSGLASGQAAQLVATDTPLGTERWAYVPKSALPYVRYLTDPNYCHMFFVDNPVVLNDVSISAGSSGSQNSSYVKTKDSWRTILIGGMGMGGACSDSTSSCTNCVKTPVSGTGYSSYFAFDVTDPTNPQLLWEFSRSDLGFSTTGPAIVRVGGTAQTNGQWYAVFASGPTGPINTTYHQFMGYSDQNLKLFVVDLAAGPGSTNNNVTIIDTGISNAFAGSLDNAAIDVDRGNPTSASFYSDDALYFGYTRDDGTQTWKQGGVLRLLTNGSTNPANWTASEVIDGIGPVTSAVAKLQDRKNNKLWLFFGTGRFYYRLNNGLTLDDSNSQRALYGIEEPCYNSSNTLTNNCVLQVAAGSLTNQSGNSPSTTLGAGAAGWFINLAPSGTTYMAERVITDPLAVFNGVVFFTTFAPSTNVCSLGGNSYLWATWYNTGGPPPVSALSGEALMQLSSGAVDTVQMKGSSGSSAFTLAGTGGRALLVDAGIVGGKPSVITAPRPLQRVLQMKEK